MGVGMMVGVKVKVGLGITAVPGTVGSASGVITEGVIVTKSAGGCESTAAWFVEASD